MKLQRNPNSWSCLSAAFAIAIDVELRHLIKWLGHDGSEITHGDLEEPLCRRGFHPQEMIKVCLQIDFHVTRVELFPTATPLPGCELKEFDTGGWDWFKENMFNSCGVIDCRTTVGTGHAMAYQGRFNHAIIYDPARTDTYVWKEPSDTEKRNRYTIALWRID